MASSMAVASKSRQITPLTLLPLLLAVMIFFVYQVLPFITQPELGDTTITVLSAARANNELEIPINGLILVPITAGALFLLGLWNLVNPQLTRVMSALTALLGVILLEYYVVFVMEYTKNDGTYLDVMGPAFWGLLILGVVMVAQVVLPRDKPGKEFQLSSMIANQESAIIIALVLLLLIVGINNPRFLATRNILDVLSGNAYIAVAALGMTMVIITGNIDISVGSLVGLLAVVSGRLAVAGAPIIVAWLVPLILGALVGALIGFTVAYLRVPSIVVTLGMLSILKGILILWTNGERVTDLPEGFFLAQMRPADIPMPIYFMIILTIIAAIWMRYSGVGRSFYAVGGNAEAARLSGISEKRVIMQVFIINGMFVGIASILYATQLTIIQATPPPALELAIITAAVVGGVSILGGKGTVIGATLAAILVNTIRSGMVFIDVSPFWIQAVQGALILITVLIDLIRRRRQTV